MVRVALYSVSGLGEPEKVTVTITSVPVGMMKVYPCSPAVLEGKVT